MTNDHDQNDIAWQKHIDRLMKKLEEPSCSIKSPVQIEETQYNDQEEGEEENARPIVITQTGKLAKTHQTFAVPLPPPPRTENSLIPSQRTLPTVRRPTQIHRTEDIAIQTDPIEKSSSMHQPCQDVSLCPCVLVRMRFFHSFETSVLLFLFSVIVN